jgi:hypothetical protein
MTCSCASSISPYAQRVTSKWRPTLVTNSRITASGSRRPRVASFSDTSSRCHDSPRRVASSACFLAVMSVKKMDSPSGEGYRRFSYQRSDPGSYTS